MKKRLIYIDNFSVGAFHEMYNASSLKMFSLIYDEVVYHTSKEVALHTFSILGEKPKNITYKPLFVTKRKNRFGNMLRLFAPIFTSLIVFLRSRKSDVFFFNYNALWALNFINIYSSLFNCKTIVCLHGEIEFIERPYPINYISKKILERTFANKSYTLNKNLYFAVLGDNIKENMKPHISELMYKKLISFDHSYIFSNEVVHQLEVSEKMKVGIVGTLRQDEKFEGLAKLSHKLNQNVEVFALGRVYVKRDTLKASNINIIKGSDKSYVSREVLDNYISEMDYVLFLSPAGSYRFTASCALFDAIDREKPILSLKNSYANYLFGKVPEIGRQFENIDEIAKFLLTGSRNIGICNYKEVKMELGPIKCGRTIKHMLKKIKLQ